ncbi:hypothetical protein VN12_00730 [Pirellula sp. SH-Sr6A]|uniref:hypothetical protein n=1 Tax=Pirellula sp. SH-Sr6A TaxID=1632865 RepID=UPI00078E577E|nr:hypothetical protein [Pirellula sp. SH-Sr6A]AMV30607.1 hypothetical protein VN12_00730 [Pirellula sp. SH-Sr6A]
MHRSWAWIATFGLGMLSTGCGSSPTPPAPATSTAASGSTPTESSSSGGAASGGSETASLEISSSGSGYGSESASSSAGYPGGSSAGAQSGGSQSGSSSYGSEETAYNGGGSYGGESEYIPPGSDQPGYGAPGFGSAGGAGYGAQGNRAGGGLLPGMGGAEAAMLSRLMGGGSANAAKKLSFQERSKLTFEAGNWNRAYDLLSAQSLLSDDAESMNIADLYRWSTANKRPVLGMKIAVGLVLDNPSNATSLKPIGTDLQSIMSGGGAGGAAGGSGPGSIGSEGGSSGGYGAEGGIAPPGAAKPSLAVGAKPLTDAAGELATRVIEAFGSHHSEGKWTVAFQESSYKGKPRMPGNNMPGSNGFGAPGSFGNSGSDLYGESGSGPGIGENSAFGGGDLGGSQSGTPTLQPFRFQQGGGGPGVGSIASGLSGFTGSAEQDSGGGNFGQSAPGQFGSGEELPVGSGFGPGAPNGFGGPGFNGSMPGGQGSRMPSPQWVAEDFELPGDVTPLGPCLEYIGSDTQANLIARSKEGGYDALMVFDVEIVLNRRTGIVNNTARVKVLHMAEDPKEIKVIASSKPLVSVSVARARLKKEEDGVEDAADSVAKKSAEIISLQPMPDRLTQDAVVKNRMPKLLADTKISQLGKLGEVNFYYQKGFIDDAQRREFFEAIAGAEASKLLSSRRTEKVEAIESLLK